MAGDVQISDSAVGGPPHDYVVPSSADFILKAVQATFDGTGAAGSFVPVVELISDSGHLIGRGKAEASVAAGASASVSFFPFNRGTASSGSTPGTAPAQTLIDVVTLSSPGTITISSIPQTFYDLTLKMNIQATAGIGGTTADALNMRVNGDAGNHYVSEQTYVHNAAPVGGAHGPTATVAICDGVPTSSDVNSQTVAITLTFPGYCDLGTSITFQKQAIVSWYVYDGPAGSARGIYGWHFTQLSKITSIFLFGTAALNLATGSQVRVYGS